MRGLALRLVASTIGVLVAGVLLAPGLFAISNLLSGIIFAIILGLLNAIIRPILIVLTFPIMILTLGLFFFVLNVILLFIAAALVPGIEVHGLLGALSASLIISFVSTVTSHLIE